MVEFDHFKKTNNNHRLSADLKLFLYNVVRSSDKNVRKMVELFVYENGTIYLNSYRVSGRKIYVSENLKFKIYKIKIEDLGEAIKNLKFK